MVQQLTDFCCYWSNVSAVAGVLSVASIFDAAGVPDSPHVSTDTIVPTAADVLTNVGAPAALAAPLVKQQMFLLLLYLFFFVRTFGIKYLLPQGPPQHSR